MNRLLEQLKARRCQKIRIGIYHLKEALRHMESSPYNGSEWQADVVETLGKAEKELAFWENATEADIKAKVARLDQVDRMRS